MDNHNVSGMSAWFRAKALMADSNVGNCRSRGCNSAACADGNIEVLLQQVFDLALDQVLLIAVDLIPEERDYIVGDFNKGRAHIVYIVILKN